MKRVTGLLGPLTSLFRFHPFQRHITHSTRTVVQTIYSNATWPAFVFVTLLKVKKVTSTELHPFTKDKSHTLLTDQPKNRSFQVLLSWDYLKCLPSSPTLHTFPSYSRKPTLFGPIVSKFREAWQSVSTISRLKLVQHQTFRTATKTIGTLLE